MTQPLTPYRARAIVRCCDTAGATRITLPAAMRRVLGWEAGDHLVVRLVVQDGQLVITRWQEQSSALVVQED